MGGQVTAPLGVLSYMEHPAPTECPPHPQWLLEGKTVPQPRTTHTQTAKDAATLACVDSASFPIIRKQASHGTKGQGAAAFLHNSESLKKENQRHLCPRHIPVLQGPLGPTPVHLPSIQFLSPVPGTTQGKARLTSSQHQLVTSGDRHLFAVA